MDKITLNLFGEEASIKIPKTLATLKSEISNKFLFSPSDVAEIIISYVKDLTKKIIKTEKDFIDFLNSKIGKINLEISQDSQLYKKSLIDIQKEKENLDKLIQQKNDAKKKYDSKLNKYHEKLSNIEKKIKKLTEKSKKISSKIEKVEKIQKNTEIKFNKKIEKLQKGINSKKNNEKRNPKKKTLKQVKKPLEVKDPNVVMVSKVNNSINLLKEHIKKILADYIKTSDEEILETKKKINESKIILKENEEKNLFDYKTITENISTEMNKWTEFIVKHTAELTDSLSKKYNECCEVINPIKKEAEKEIKLKAVPKKLNHAKKVVHYGTVCKGCLMSPIFGNRFKCAACDDYDYCEKCEEKNKNCHLHPFVKIYNPEMAPVQIKCEIK